MGHFFLLHRRCNSKETQVFFGSLIIGFFRGGCPRGGGNWGTVRIPREDWGKGTLGKIRGISTPP